MNGTTRRQLLSGGAVLGAAAVAWPLSSWLRPARPDVLGPRVGGRPLRPDPDGVLDLVEGFTYRVVSTAGDRMSDGIGSPPRPDGMAVFDHGGSWVLMRNHEIPSGTAARLYGGPAPGPAYVATAGGSVSRLVLDPETLAVRHSHLALSGTAVNCAGGASPWGWLSCEETEEDGHGYVFLTDPTADGILPPQRIDAYGRFKHEAVALRPETHVAYLTEDQGDGVLYRFVPYDPARPFEGRLQAMALDAGDTTTELTTGERREVRWIDLPGDIQSTGLRHRARAQGAALVRRGEGICRAQGDMVFCSTTGGRLQGGQVFRLSDEGDGGELSVIAACDSPDDPMDMPDNITLGPRGLLLFAEDCDGRDHLRIIRPDGAVETFARNALSDSELCGPCFSPDGSTLFVNVQEDGLTLAVRGPFEELA